MPFTMPSSFTEITRLAKNAGSRAYNAADILLPDSLKVFLFSKMPIVIFSSILASHSAKEIFNKAYDSAFANGVADANAADKSYNNPAIEPSFYNWPVPTATIVGVTAYSTIQAACMYAELASKRREPSYLVAAFLTLASGGIIIAWENLNAFFALANAGTNKGYYDGYQSECQSKGLYRKPDCVTDDELSEDPQAGRETPLSLSAPAKAAVGVSLGACALYGLWKSYNKGLAESPIATPANNSESSNDRSPLLPTTAVLPTYEQAVQVQHNKF